MSESTTTGGGEAARVPPKGSEERAFWLEAATFHGFEQTYGGEEIPEYDPPAYFATESEVLALMAACRDQGRRDAALAAQPAPTQPAAQGEPVAHDWKLVPAVATRDWAYDLATYRQGRSSTPRCEGPTQGEVEWGMDRIREVLAVAPQAPVAPTQPAATGRPSVDEVAQMKSHATHAIIGADVDGAGYDALGAAAVEAVLALLALDRGDGTRADGDGVGGNHA